MPEMIQDTQGLFHCVLCRQKFKNKDRCIQHRTKCTPKSAAESNSYKFYCEKCNKKFPIQKYVYRHQKQFCEFVDASDKYMHQCEVCLHRFSSKSNYNRHRKINKCGGPNAKTGNNSNKNSQTLNSQNGYGNTDTNTFQVNNYAQTPTIGNQPSSSANSSVIQNQSAGVSLSNSHNMPTMQQQTSNKEGFDNHLREQPNYQELLFGGLVPGIFSGHSKNIPVFPEMMLSDKNNPSRKKDNANPTIPVEMKSQTTLSSQQSLADSVTGRIPEGQQLNTALANPDLFGGLVPGIPEPNACMFLQNHAQPEKNPTMNTESEGDVLPQETGETNNANGKRTDIKEELMPLDQDVSPKQGGDAGENLRSTSYKF